MVDRTQDTPDNGSEREHDPTRPVDDADALIPIEKEPRHAPPFDVDERTGASPESEAIAMPLRAEAESPRRSRWNDTIDELVPLPQDEPYHDNDLTGADPNDVRDPIDIHLPQPTGDATTLVDDASTGEELLVDNAPAGADTALGLDAEADAAGAPLVDDPELDSFEAGYEATSSAMPKAERADGTTVCPTCGNTTDALRFCGYCGGALTESRREITGDTSLQRLLSRAEGYLEPLAHWTRPGGVRAILAIGAALILIALLANSGAMALVIGATILPAAILFWCRQSDVFENEPWYIVAGFVILGVVTGALLGWLGAFTTTHSWFDEGVLNYGAAGFGGQFAESAGTAPFVVWLLCGMVIPIAALAAIIAAPLLLRQTLSLRNEIMDGLTLAAAMGGGYAIGTAIVFVAPLFGQSGPAITASGWTLTTIGLAILRPLIWTLAGGMLGAAGWRYMLSGSLSSALVPAAAGIAIPLFATLSSIQLGSTGLWAEILLGVVAATVAAMLYQRTLVNAVREDRRVIGGDTHRVVCPHCHRVTPTGQYCAHCGQELRSVS